ncbi:MAG: transglutaminase-like domain-containing protein [Thermoanaerobaculia bacterium]
MNDRVYVHPTEARRRFVELSDSNFGNGDLARGALLVALEEYPHLDVDAALRSLDGIAERALARGGKNDPASFKLGYLQTEFFDTEGFRGNITDYYDVRNSMLNEVIERKTGIPITLSIAFMHVAQRMGLKVSGIGLPGHYIVQVQIDLSTVYIDPFQIGVTLSMSDIDKLLYAITDGKRRLQKEFLRAWSARETLMRVLANLEGAWMRVGATEKAASAHERVEILAGIELDQKVGSL